MKSLWQAVHCLIHFHFPSARWLRPNLLENSGDQSNRHEPFEWGVGNTISSCSGGKLLSLLISLSFLIFDKPTSSFLHTENVTCFSSNIKTAPILALCTKSSNWFYFSVYTAVHLFAHCFHCINCLVFYCELLEARCGACFIYFIQHCVHMCRCNCVWQ